MSAQIHIPQPDSTKPISASTPTRFLIYAFGFLLVTGVFIYGVTKNPPSERPILLMIALAFTLPACLIFRFGGRIAVTDTTVSFRPFIGSERSIRFDEVSSLRLRPLTLASPAKTLRLWQLGFRRNDSTKINHRILNALESEFDVSDVLLFPQRRIDSLRDKEEWVAFSTERAAQLEQIQRELNLFIKWMKIMFPIYLALLGGILALAFRNGESFFWQIPFWLRPMLPGLLFILFFILLPALFSRSARRNFGGYLRQFKWRKKRSL